MNFANKQQDILEIEVSAEDFIRNETASRTAYQAAQFDHLLTTGEDVDMPDKALPLGITPEWLEQKVKTFLHEIWLEGEDPEETIFGLTENVENNKRRVSLVSLIGAAADAIEARCNCSYYRDEITPELREIIS